MIKKRIKVCVMHPLCYPLQKGNWVDLSSHNDINFEKDKYFEVPLGIITELPKWYKAVIKPRSSMFKKYGILQTNSPGEIEHNYCEEWVLPVYSVRNENISLGERLCQMQVYLREDAPWYMKLLDLFTNLEIKYVTKDKIKGNRSGLGSTGRA